MTYAHQIPPENYLILGVLLFATGVLLVRPIVYFLSKFSDNDDWPGGAA